LTYVKIDVRWKFYVLEQMRTNPGGGLAPSAVVGRDRLIEKLWQVLERQSLVLTAERRMGKTSIIKKMAAQPQSGMRVFEVKDLEALRSPLEFVDCILQDVDQELSTRNRVMNRVREFMAQFGGAEVKGLKLPQLANPHWKIILTKIMEDLTEHQEGLQVFLWDEIPMMLNNIKCDQGEPVAMEVLDTLRSLRQTFPRLRMVFTGSIGLHHVIGRLKETGYANSPINDMLTEDVAPLALEDACDLAEQLIKGEALRTEDGKMLAQTVAMAVDCFPYYIHHVINDLKWTASACTPEQVDEIVRANLCNDSDRWDLAHYRERIDSYYLGLEQTLALGILDEIAATDVLLSQRELLDRAGMQGGDVNPELARKVLKLLGRDHYIQQQPDGAYRFKFDLIRRYWQFSRGL
jgi:hypothetical protein